LPDRLLPLVRELMGDSSRRATMRQAMQALTCPTAAASIAQILFSLVATPSHRRN